MSVQTHSHKMSSRTRDITNHRFGRLLVIRFIEYRGKNKDRAFWECVCDCGNRKEAYAGSLFVGDLKSCGCLAKDITLSSHTTHGLTNHSSGIYKIWTGIIQRCTNPKSNAFKYYGGRGIKICDEWVNSVESFFKYVGDRPSKLHTIDRIDSNGNYEPGNVRWATKAEQQQNKRNTIVLIINGVSATVSEWSKLSGTNRQTITTRYFRGYSHEECVYGRNLTKYN